MIIASAIMFYIEKTDKTVTLCGRRHGDIFAQLKALGFEPRKGYKEIEQGFIDHKGNFLNREQAFDHAVKCGQVTEQTLKYTQGKSCGLMSELLW